MNVYRGYASQYGHGLGNVLGGVARAALPIVKNIAKQAGAQLLDSGINYIQKKLRKPAKRTVKHATSRPAKRATLRPAGHKKRKPPGKPVRRSTRNKKPRDILGS